MAEKSAYTAAEIKVLEGLEGVRRRPSMYVGSTGKDGLHHLVYEVVDNSVDEALVGYCKKIVVIINKNGSVTVEDDGRGIPVDMHPTLKIPAVEVALTRLHAGGKFDKKTYAISGGLHGVGVSVVNALSEKLIVEVKREGKIYSQEYSRGQTKTKLTQTGKAESTGTTITFWPDKEIFSTTTFDYKVLETRFQEIAFLNPGLKITLIDEEKNKKEEFYSSGGLIEFVKWLNLSKEAIHKPIYFKKEVDHTVIEVAIQYNSSYQENIFGFVNTINTVEGGTHVSGFKTALTRAINDYAKNKNLLKNESLLGDDVREGLTVVLSLKMEEPQFEGQTKTKLGNSEIKGFVDSEVSRALSEFFEENPAIARKITSKALESAKARIAARKAKDLVRRKNAFSLGGLPGKLADCSSKKSENTELYIVEGESAGGCFSGDTKVALADGRNVSFKELVEEHKLGKENFCYTIKKDGSIGIERIEAPRLTRKNAEVIKIILDNNEEIICTPDHGFMLRDGSYKEAKNLTKKDSLMPLNRKISKIGGRITIDGYEMVWNQKRKWIFTHMLADEYNSEKEIYPIKQGDTRHHIDFNKLNNNPTNIIRIPKEEHLILHTENLSQTIHRQDIKEKAAKAHQTPEYRKKMSDWAIQPEVKKMLSEKSKKQWQDEEYKKYMTKKFIEFYNSNKNYRTKNNELLNEEQKKYWSNSKNRKRASEKVKKFFEENPDAKEYLSGLAKEQWRDEALIIWRRQKTSEQWTPEFRQKRKISYDKTYYNKTITFMKKIIEQEGNLVNFDRIRIRNKDKSILSMKTFCERFFNGNKDLMLESINNHNHKIKRIEWLKERIDVYDLEVSYTHNFALASGVFVHNSAKMARNKEIQAILPLKGKILNVEKSSPARALSSEEIANLITAIGTGVGESFDITKLRYNKIILMCDADSVTFDTPLLLFNDKGELFHQQIGDFVEKCVSPDKYKISSLSINPGKHKIKNIVNIVKHPLRTSLYKIKTHLGYNVDVTPYHSVFVYDKEKIGTKATKDIGTKDYILIPRSLPRTDKEIIVDLRNLARDYDIRMNLAKDEIQKIPKSSYADLSIENWKKLRELRKSKKISRREMGEMLGIYPTILQQWEYKIDNVMPKYGLFKKYLSLIGYDINKLNFNLNVPLKYSQESDSGKFYFKDHTSEIKLQLNLDNNLAYLLGWYIGDGTSSKGKKNPYRFSLCIGKDKEAYLGNIKNSIKGCLGCNVILEKNADNTVIHFNSLSFGLLLKKLGLFKKHASEKFVADILYNAKRTQQVSFLKGLLQSDGSIVIGKSKSTGDKAIISHTTASKKLMEGIVFLYRQLGMLPSITSRKPKDHYYKKILIKSNYTVYEVNIGSIRQLQKAKDIWEDHKNARKLINFISKARKKYDRKYIIDVNEDFQAVKVLKVEKIDSDDKFVYDLSVDLNRSFVGGLGGLTLHNTDGEHIKTLLLTFFYRFMPQLIENSHVYAALPPLYRIRKGNKDRYVYSDEELKKEIWSAGAANVTRFKGLGEMSSQQLWDTTMNPKTRKIKKIFIEDAVEADRVFSMLMGDDVQARKAFIQENAKEATLDI